MVRNDLKMPTSCIIYLVTMALRKIYHYITCSITHFALLVKGTVPPLKKLSNVHEMYAKMLRTLNLTRFFLFPKNIANFERY